MGLVLLTALTGVAFPLALAAVARPLFPHEANGSLLERDGVAVGSELIGQDFAAPGHFHPRPSAAGGGHDATASGGTNLSPSHAKLRDGSPDDPATPADESFAGLARLAADCRVANGLAPDASVPVDAVTRSGSGLDPHISPANAALQLPRVARARSLDEQTVRRLVADHAAGRQWGFLGEPRVAVVALNLALDRGDAPATAGPGSDAMPDPPDSTLVRWLECAAFLALVLGLAWPVGGYVARVFERQPTRADAVLLSLERGLHRLLGVDPARAMGAGLYAGSFVAFGMLGALLLAQAALPSGRTTASSPRP